MRTEKISDTRVKCIIDSQELLSYGIDINTSQKEWMESFRTHINELAEDCFRQEGIDLREGTIDVKIQINEDEVSLDFSYNDLDRQLSPIAQLLESLGLNNIPPLPPPLMERLNNQAPEFPVPQKQDLIKDNEKISIYQFNCLDDVLNLSQRIEPRNSSLFKYEDKYYLMMKTDNKLDLIVSEFCNEKSNLSQEFLEEHATTIIKNVALENLSQIF